MQENYQVVFPLCYLHNELINILTFETRNRRGCAAPQFLRADVTCNQHRFRIATDIY